MKKVALFVLFFVFCVSSAFAGPFGIDMGMTLTKVKEVCKGSASLYEGDVYIITPPKTNNMFETYLVWIDSDYGVYRLRAICEEIKDDDYGTQLRTRFNNLVSSIEKTYGEHREIDVCEDTFMDNARYFMYTLRNGGRALAAIWASEYQSTLPSDIYEIAIWVEATSTYDNLGCVFLEYEFSNYAKVEAKADSVF